MNSIGSLNTIQTQGYMRRINLQTDLAQLADLIELVFSSTMDNSERAALREMRAMSRFGAGLRMLSRLNEVTAGVHLGFVWMVGDRLVGNVSIYPANYPTSLGKTWIVANVGVHPDFQGRGIAKQLMQASMELIQQKEGKRAILQVDADNLVAVRLYESLGFTQERTWINWKRNPSTRLPDATRIEGVYIRHPRRSDWHSEWQLAQQLRANGGLGWLRPLHPTLFRRTWWGTWLNWLSFRATEKLVIRSDDDQHLLACAWIETSLTSANKLTLLISDENHAQNTQALLQTIIRRFGNNSLMLEHPEDDTQSNTWLSHYHFLPKRTVINMTWKNQ